MRSSLVLSALLLAACEPPDEVVVGETDPRIEIIFPPSDSTVPLNENCMLDLVVAVDIDNLDLVPPPTDTADGQGHWHFRFTETVYFPTSDPFLEIYDEEGFGPGDFVEARATLQDNEHGDLDMFLDWEDTVEFTIGQPIETGVTCP